MRDIDWDSCIIQVLGKGENEGYAPFGKLTKQYLKVWLNEFQPKLCDRIWDIGFGSVKDILERLRKEIGLRVKYGKGSTRMN